MEKVNLPEFYELGERLALFSSKTKKDSWLDIALAAHQAEMHVIMLLTTYKELQYCRAAGDELLQSLSMMRREFEEMMEKRIDPAKAKFRISISQVTEKAKEFRTLLLEELFKEPVFRVTATVGYDTDILLTQAERNLPESAKMKLRSEVVSEIRESGKCLAYNIPTAAGFHILRALELVMIDYYFAVCKPSKKKPLSRWQAYINALRKEWKKTGGKSVAKVIAILEDMAASDRNLIMHPKKVLTLDEALTLFKQCESAMISMASKLPRDEQQYANKLGELGIKYKRAKREDQ